MTDVLTPTWIEVDLAPETETDLRRVMVATGLGTSDAINRAVMLYRLLTDQASRGQNVFTADPGGRTVNLITDPYWRTAAAGVLQ